MPEIWIHYYFPLSFECLDDKVSNNSMHSSTRDFVSEESIQVGVYSDIMRGHTRLEIICVVLEFG